MDFWDNFFQFIGFYKVGIVLSQNTDGPDIDERALLWGLWWALTETKHDVELNTHKMGSMRYR